MHVAADTLQELVRTLSANEHRFTLGSTTRHQIGHLVHNQLRRTITTRQQPILPHQVHGEVLLRFRQIWEDGQCLLGILQNALDRQEEMMGGLSSGQHGG